jgi:hypothetical protein
MRYFGTADNSCNQEAEEEHFGAENWPRDVLAAVQSGKTPSFALLSAKRTDQLEGTDHSFAVVRRFWSRATGHASPTRWCAPEKTELREAVRAAFGKTFFELEVDWKAYVLANYPARARPPPPGVERKISADELRGFPDR